MWIFGCLGVGLKFIVYFYAILEVFGLVLGALGFGWSWLGVGLGGVQLVPPMEPCLS